MAFVGMGVIGTKLLVDGDAGNHLHLWYFWRWWLTIPSPEKMQWHDTSWQHNPIVGRVCETIFRDRWGVWMKFDALKVEERSWPSFLMYDKLYFLHSLCIQSSKGAYHKCYTHEFPQSQNCTLFSEDMIVYKRFPFQVGVVSERQNWGGASICHQTGPSQFFGLCSNKCS